jgi:lipid-binding SYLF domain-containing protein
LAEIQQDAAGALEKLYARSPAAKALGQKAAGILVFPSILKAGLMIGGQYGEGALMQGGKWVRYYSTAGASYGLQAGAQTYGYALFLMTPAAIRQLDSNDGWEVGVGPSVVVVDEGMAKSLTTTTMNDDVYAFIFSQKGLMGGIGVQGNKITRIAEVIEHRTDRRTNALMADDALTVRNEEDLYP